MVNPNRRAMKQEFENQIIKRKVSQILRLLEINPSEAFQRFLNLDFDFSKLGTSLFWNSFNDFNLNRLRNIFPHFENVFDKLEILQFLYNLACMYNETKTKWIKEILSMNPDRQALLKALFVNLELGDASPQPSDFPSYSEDSLTALKNILSEISPQLVPDNSTGYSVHLAQLCRNLINAEMDMILVAKCHDYVSHGGMVLEPKNDGYGSVAKYPTKYSAERRLNILNQFKTGVSRQFQRNISQTNLSKLDHFKINDPLYKSDQGILSVLHNSNVSVSGLPEGTTSMQVDDSFFDELKSDDPEIRTKGSEKIIELLFKQSFNYHLRQALSGIYLPKDHVNAHQFRIRLVENLSTSVFEFICVVSCLVAKAWTFQNLSDFPGSSIMSFKRALLYNLIHCYPDESQTILDDQTNSLIVHELSVIEKNHIPGAFHLFEMHQILSLLSEVEDLKQTPSNVLEAIVNLISNISGELPFNPIYKIDELYYFSYKSFTGFDVNRIIYDFIVSDRLFNVRKINSLELPREAYHKVREQSMVGELKLLFMNITPYVIANETHHDVLGAINYITPQAEFDLIAYSKEENTFLIIQVKLSNIAPRTEKRKMDWIEKNIKCKAIEQLQKDLEFIQSDIGLLAIFNRFNLEVPWKVQPPTIDLLILSESYLYDHEKVTMPNSEQKILCISFFELKNLILNQQVNKMQSELPIIIGSKRPIQLLKKSIEENVFWEFLNDDVEKYSFSHSTKVIEQQHSLEFRI